MALRPACMLNLLVTVGQQVMVLVLLLEQPGGLQLVGTGRKATFLAELLRAGARVDFRAAARLGLSDRDCWVTHVTRHRPQRLDPALAQASCWIGSRCALGLVRLELSRISLFQSLTVHVVHIHLDVHLELLGAPSGEHLIRARVLLVSSDGVCGHGPGLDVRGLGQMLLVRSGTCSYVWHAQVVQVLLLRGCSPAAVAVGRDLPLSDAQ